VRFSYALRSAGERRLTKSSGRDAIQYLRFSAGGLTDVREVQLSNFLEVVHSYTLHERPAAAREFENQARFMGPIVAASGGGESFLAAYEHGSQVPDAFLEFALSADRGISLQAVKGNYLAGQPLGPQSPFRTLWFEAAAIRGGIEDLRQAYREFILKYLALYPASRTPFIFYNTWNFQERNKFWNGKSYLDSMNNGRLLQEIGAAHRMGIEVFVIDTGWYEKTGDWAVSPQRFPDGLAAIRKSLAERGMRLGLWFSPVHAAVSSPLAAQYADCRMSWRGREHAPHPVWETEPSYRMCLVSRYADAFADRLIQLHRELGVTYFKWDAVDQYGCDDPRHGHGDESHSPEERAQSYAFQLPLALSRIAEKVAAAAPGAIIDFDITEAGRSVGLGFLSAGKYFLINNGPYYQNYDVPIDPVKDNWNLFFHKGPARTWICRAPLSYDSWIPSVLFLTHYFPDDPAESQMVNLASLILGQNGIWGDLLQVSPEGAALFHRWLSAYKQVREDITDAPPVRSGPVSGSAEIHEKISPRTGRGVVAVFSTARGRVSYITQRPASRGYAATENVRVSFDPAGRARLDIDFSRPGAQLVLFGAK
jgi:alpha-galactosidase